MSPESIFPSLHTWRKSAGDKGTGYLTLTICLGSAIFGVMARLARVVVPGLPHHVTQRGNRGINIFRDDGDRRVYIRLLRKYQAQYPISVWAYCLMSNHVHLIVVPQKEGELSLWLHDIHATYAQYLNDKLDENGHLWQGRFFSCPLDEEHQWAAIRYVERNPVKALIVQHAKEYPWSSAPAHCGLRRDPLLAKDFPHDGLIDDWQTWLLKEDESKTKAIRAATKTGRPCGSSQFIDQLEQKLGRVLHCRKPGPERKENKGERKMNSLFPELKRRKTKGGKEDE